MSEITQPARRIVLGAPPAYVQIEISALGPPAPGLSLRGKEEKEEESRAEQRGERERGKREGPSIHFSSSSSLVAHRISSCKMTRRNEYMSRREQGARPRGRDGTAKAWLSISKAIMKTDETLDLALLRDFPIFPELYYYTGLG